MVLKPFKIGAIRAVNLLHAENVSSFVGRSSTRTPLHLINEIKLYIIRVGLGYGQSEVQF